MTEFGHWMDQNRSEPGQKYFFLQLTRELGVKSNRYNQSKISAPSHSLIRLLSCKIKKQSIKPISDDKRQLWKKKKKRERDITSLLFICLHPIYLSFDSLSKCNGTGYPKRPWGICCYVADWSEKQVVLFKGLHLLFECFSPNQLK